MSESHDGQRVDRRTVLRAAGVSALAVAGLGAAGAACAQPGDSGLITRALPGSAERVPVIGLGTFMTFDRIASADRRFIPEVLRTFFDGGGRVVDTSALYGASEDNVGEFARELGVTDRLFLTDKSWACGEYLFDSSHADRQFARSLERLHRERLDVVGVHSMTNVGMILPILRRLKGEGKIRYVGVTSHEAYQYAGMEGLIQGGVVDFVQVRYSIFQRAAAERVLAVAADRGGWGSW
ncbi:aldo/keto reductase [Nocardia crassostreae]|uniref:aldo/keto reductase n=1 Tax=Nocardia crassostreae TaxID=53428 RepID=UPI0012FB33A3|nr:aldo/keto reductase [Nocardia crassostreae]